jgi:anti-sigma factor RsiW
MTHIADNQDALLDYLYEEGDPADRLKIATHLQECATCSVAVLEFQTVRGMLSEWKPPASQLGFRIVQDPSPKATPPQRPPGERWLHLAAAALLFVGGMAVSQLNVDYGNGALTVRTRSAEPAAPPTVTASASGPRGESAVSAQALQDLEQSLRAELREAQNTPNMSRPDIASTEQLLQRVRAMIEQSEMRQQRELALRLSQVAREVDTQHQADLLRIQQDFGQQQDMMEYLVRTSGGVK